MLQAPENYTSKEDNKLPVKKKNTGEKNSVPCDRL